MNRGDGRFVQALGGDRDREPSRRTINPDAVAVSPVAARVLNAVEQEDGASLPDGGEVATPWEVVALRYKDGGQIFSPLFRMSFRGQDLAILRPASASFASRRSREESS